MYRINNHFWEFSIVSGLYGYFSEFFIGIKYSYIILMVFIITDTITGVASAMKYQRLSSKGISRLLKKILTYSLTITIVRLFEVAIVPLSDGTLLSQIFLAYLLLIELISILENLTLLGVPMPNNIISILIKYTKIPGLEKLLNESNSNLISYASEVDEILHLQLQAIENPKIQQLVEIKLLIWRKMIINLTTALKNNNEMNNDLMYYKIVSIFQSGITEIEEKWSAVEIPKELITSFNHLHQQKIDYLISNVKKISYSEGNFNEKMEQIIKAIIITLYQTMIDAKKVEKN